MDVRELYQDMIVDHSRSPRNFGPLEEATSSADGYNPLCGDRIRVWVDADADTIRKVSFEGQGCAISTASASIMTEMLKGKTRDEAARLIDLFHDLVRGENSPGGTDPGKLAVFAGVRDYPSRVKCAVLAWHALKAALEGGGRVSTE